MFLTFAEKLKSYLKTISYIKYPNPCYLKNAPFGTGFDGIIQENDLERRKQFVKEHRPLLIITR
jgi:hypothetical protein